MTLLRSAWAAGLQRDEETLERSRCARAFAVWSTQRPRVEGGNVLEHPTLGLGWDREMLKEETMSLRSRGSNLRRRRRRKRELTLQERRNDFPDGLQRLLVLFEPVAA